jgi:hypothetical protein
VHLIIKWRDTSPRGLAAWGNLPLNQRVLDLLADIMFATDEIREMVALEHGFPPFEGFDDALDRIYVDAESLMGRLGER